ncbi:hypothetical protein GCM10027046_13750 [Uliginosibacterium flavum]
MGVDIAQPIALTTLAADLQIYYGQQWIQSGMTAKIRKSKPPSPGAARHPLPVSGRGEDRKSRAVSLNIPSFAKGG